MLRHSKLILWTLENHYNCGVLFRCDSFLQEEGRKSTRWPAIGRNKDCDWSNFCFLFHCWNFLYRILSLIVNKIIELGKKFVWVFLLHLTKKSEQTYWPAQYSEKVLLQYGVGGGEWDHVFWHQTSKNYLGPKLQWKRSTIRKKNIVGSFGEDSENGMWKTHIWLFLTYQVLGRYHWKLFYFYQIKVILSFNDKWYLPENYFNNTYLRLDGWEIVEYDMKVFPYAVFIYYFPFTYLDFVIQGTATERSLDMGSQDLNSVICFSIYM